MLLESSFCESELQYLLMNSLRIIRMYDWIIDSYVLDFYTNNHWGHHGNEQNIVKRVWPLSLIALKIALQQLCLPRNVIKKNLYDNAYDDYDCKKLLHPRLKNIFLKCVKPKKQHEIENMARICYHSAKQYNVQYIVDVGSGLGHLARRLAYGYGLNVCCLEMQAELNKQARKIDNEFEISAVKHLDSDIVKRFNRPIHETIELTKQTTPEEFLYIIKKIFNIVNNNDNNLKLGIVGLHPCGDLGAILIDLFLKCNEVKFINLVGCCYMKLTTKLGAKVNNGDNTLIKGKKQNYLESDFIGYPLCKYLKGRNLNFTKLSYESREIACHAIEMYKSRLEKGLYENLKVHSYRATLEEIIIKYWPEYKHYGLKSIRHKNSLTFESYCEKALKGLPLRIPLKDIKSSRTQRNLEQWKNVVIFYTLRLIFAPLIESVILYDRILYLMEKNCNISVKAIFDPLISPRNHITIATKNR